MIIQIIHNPTAGNENHGKNELLELARYSENVVHYVSTQDDNWEDMLQHKPTTILVAGGDGTFHKVAGLLLDKAPKNSIPIRMLPLGTANNIAKSLNISFSSECRKTKQEAELLNFDVGSIRGFNNEGYFFESVGFGIFPELIRKMKKNDNPESTEEKLKITLKTLGQILSDFEPKKAKLQVDGITIKGSFLLVELMNTKYVGPNLELAPQADPTDGFLDLILIHENRREQFEQYLSNLIDEKKQTVDLLNFITAIRVKKVQMKWNGDNMHVDDTLIPDYSGERLKLKVRPKSLTMIKNKKA